MLLFVLLLFLGVDAVLVALIRTLMYWVGVYFLLPLLIAAAFSFCFQNVLDDLGCNPSSSDSESIFSPPVWRGCESRHTRRSRPHRPLCPSNLGNSLRLCHWPKVRKDSCHLAISGIKHWCRTELTMTNHRYTFQAGRKGGRAWWQGPA